MFVVSSLGDIFTSLELFLSYASVSLSLPVELEQLSEAEWAFTKQCTEM